MVKKNMKRTSIPVYPETRDRVKRLRLRKPDGELETYDEVLMRITETHIRKLDRDSQAVQA